jgi:hypothetical protein
LNTLAEVSGGLATCGCGPSEMTKFEADPATTGACCGD